MKMHSLISRLLLSYRSWPAAVLLVLSAVLCEAGRKPPLFVDPSFDPSSIAQFDIYIVDLTNNGQNNHECMTGALVGANTALLKRGYNKLGRRGEERLYVAQSVPSEEMLSNPTPQWLQDLGDQKSVGRGKNRVLEHVPTSQWIMILALGELGSRANAIKGLGNAALSVYLYDRTQATLLWHDQSEQRMWGGLMGNLLQKGDIKQGTCSDLASLMIYKLPKHKNAKH